MEEKEKIEDKEKIDGNTSDLSDTAVEDYSSSIKQNTYDPKTSDRIICIELKNNQQILISYTESWTIKDLILAIINRREYRMLNQDRNFIMSSNYHSQLFDLSLCFYDDIKPSQENKLSENVLLDKLHILGLLKNHRAPFLILKENFAPLSYIYSPTHRTQSLKEISNSKNNQYAMYYDFLPNIIKWNPNFLLAHPELENYFIRNKKGYNDFSPYRRNKLTCDDDNIDWLIYDKESINFLMEMNKKEFKEIACLKYINGGVYFEDKVKYDEEKKSEDKDKKKEKKNKVEEQTLFVNVTLFSGKQDQNNNALSKKFQINSSTTAFDLIQKMAEKVTAADQNMKYDPRSKILKVKGLNDYVFNLKEPLINYSYLNECAKNNKIAEYLIIDNPAMNTKNEKENSPGKYISQTLMPSSALAGLNDDQENTKKKNLVSVATLTSKNDLDKIAVYNPRNDDFSDDLPYVAAALTKFPVKSNQSSNTPLDKLIDSINKEIDANLEKINNMKNSKLKENQIKNYEDEKEKEMSKTQQHIPNMFLHLNGNGAMYFEKKKKYSKLKNIVQKNVFLKNEKNTPQKEIIPLINTREMHLSKVLRPFSIIFRSAQINTKLDPYETDNITLLFKFELYCSSLPIGTPKQIRWTTNTGVRSPVFNKRLYFDISYSQLPNYCSVIVKVKYIGHKDKAVNKKDIVFWDNYRLFDQNNKLKVGLHKINLHDREICDDIYYVYNDNPNEENSNKIYFEIENFACPIINKVRYTDGNNKVYERQLEIDSDDLIKISKIDDKSPFDALNHSEKAILWRNRFGIAKMSSLIPKLFLSDDYNNPNTNKELEKIIKLTTDITIVQAIELLSGKYVNEIVRTFAVSILKKQTVSDIKQYLLQLVQALKYEKYVDSSLARFLLEKAISNPITIGHEFFWHLRAEMYNQDVQQKFGLYLEIFVNKINSQLYKIFKDEDNLLKTLIIFAEKVKLNKVKEERNKQYREDLSGLNQQYKNKKKEVSLPLNFKYRIKGLIVDKCRVMNSKKKPLWLTFENADPLGDNIVAMLKCGDDLRMDMVTLQLFQAMQTLWFDDGLQVKMSLYKVLCTGYMQGMLEMVTNSETLANIHVKEGGALGQLITKGSVYNWIEKNCKDVSMNDAKENFLISNVAYCLATFILGVGDRHNDNIMIKKNGELFHIDFGHFLGHFKYKMGIKRERAPFVFTRQFQYVLGDDNSELFLKFKKELNTGYMIIRKNKEVILTLLKVLLCTGIPELNEKSLKFLDGSLYLRKSDREASEFLEKKLFESMDSFSTKLNFAVHIIANK